MSAYRQAPEVEEVANKIIEQHRPDLVDVDIVYVFIDKAPTSMGRVVWGRARRIGGLNAVLANLGDYDGELCAEPDPFYVVEISEDIWQGLDVKRRRALVDHELMHLLPVPADDGKINYKMRGHDFEEFGVIIRRHGLWTSAADAMGKQVMEQLALAIDDLTDKLNPPPKPPKGGST